MKFIAHAVFLLIMIAGAACDSASGKDSFTFAVVSDSHTGGTTKTGTNVYARIIEMLNEKQPDLLVHCGDWIIGPTYDKGGAVSTRDTFLTYTAMLDSTIAFYPALGNHEGDYEGYEYSRSVFPVFGDDGYYSFDHRSAHFFVVENNSDASDSTLRGYRDCKPNGGLNTPGSPQRTWLDSDLAARGDGIVWTFGFGHRPYYGAEGYAGRKNVFEGRRGADSVCRIMEDAGVDIFFAGDQHCYTRTTPIRDGQAWTETDSSTVHITCGGAGGRINRGSKKKLAFPVLDDLPPDTYVAGTKTHHFFVFCTVTPGEFTAEVIDTSGALLDRFSIQK